MPRKAKEMWEEKDREGEGSSGLTWSSSASRWWSAAVIAIGLTNIMVRNRMCFSSINESDNNNDISADNVVMVMMVQQNIMTMIMALMQMMVVMIMVVMNDDDDGGDS